MKINNDTHPIAFVRYLTTLRPDIEKFTFCMYECELPEDAEEYSQLGRRPMWLAPEEITVEWVESTCEDLPERWEFGLSSTVAVTGNIGLVIPMIDFKSTDLAQVRRIAKAAAPTWEAPWLYQTARSFHAYFPSPLTIPEWQNYMTRLTMFEDDIDQEWVRIQRPHGHTVLRWSANTNKHTVMPAFVG